MNDTNDLPSYMTKFSGLTEEQRRASIRVDLDRVTDMLNQRDADQSQGARWRLLGLEEPGP